MIKDKSIQIKNIFYMLSYAFHALRKSNFMEIAAEKFENIHDLFAAILAKGISTQMKKGLYKEYSEISEDSPILRGKLEINGTINNKLNNRCLLSCTHDEFTENNLLNQILKSTAVILLNHPNVKRQRKEDLKKILKLLNTVDRIDLKRVHWRHLNFSKNNQNYIMLTNICYFISQSLVISDGNGSFKVNDFVDDQQMSRLYEKFILEFYRYHYKQINASPAHIDWDTDDNNIQFLPEMKTDILLRYRDKTLIIDAKYYKHTMQYNPLYDSTTLHSNNMYQIYSYVKNYDTKHIGNVSGMLLYARTDEALQPDQDYMISGNKISVKTLDLNQEFIMIAKQLKDIAHTYLGV